MAWLICPLFCDLPHHSCGLTNRLPEHGPCRVLLRSNLRPSLDGDDEAYRVKNWHERRNISHSLPQIGFFARTFELLLTPKRKSLSDLLLVFLQGWRCQAFAAIGIVNISSPGIHGEVPQVWAPSWIRPCGLEIKERRVVTILDPRDFDLVTRIMNPHALTHKFTRLVRADLHLIGLCTCGTRAHYHH